jgi:phosphate-selective porin
LDGALHLSSYIEVKGEYINSWVQTDDLGTIHQHGLWVQGAYKLAGLKLESPLVNNLEFVGRYDTLHDGFSTRANRYTIGYIYYITNTLLFEGDYEFASSNNDLLNHNRLVFQLSFGF